MAKQRILREDFIGQMTDDELVSLNGREKDGPDFTMTVIYSIFKKDVLSEDSNVVRTAYLLYKFSNQLFTWMKNPKLNMEVNYEENSEYQKIRKENVVPSQVKKFLEDCLGQISLKDDDHMFVDLELQFNVPYVSPKFKKFAKEFNFFWDRVFRSQHGVMFNIQEAQKERRDLKPFLNISLMSKGITYYEMKTTYERLFDKCDGFEPIGPDESKEVYDQDYFYGTDWDAFDKPYVNLMLYSDVFKGFEVNIVAVTRTSGAFMYNPYTSYSRAVVAKVKPLDEKHNNSDAVLDIGKQMINMINRQGYYNLRDMFRMIYVGFVLIVDSDVIMNPESKHFEYEKNIYGDARVLAKTELWVPWVSDKKYVRVTADGKIFLENKTMEFSTFDIFCVLEKQRIQTYLSGKKKRILLGDDNED